MRYMETNGESSLVLLCHGFPGTWYSWRHQILMLAETGFRGGLNFYRNLDRNWELMASFSDTKVMIPALYMVGDRDFGLSDFGLSISGMR